jgi:hypothetical protein
MRKIQERTEYRDADGTLLLAEDWSDTGETVNSGAASERVRELNRNAKRKGLFTRYRSVEDEGFWR